MTDDLREARRLQLFALMKRHKLKRNDVAELLGVSVHTVASWHKRPTAKSTYPVPRWAVELLSYKVGEKP